MATKKISELEEINQAENDDYLVVVDTSESKNKKITKENFLKISALEEKISDLENNQLTASTEGTSIDINDSADYQVREMIPNGNVIQNSTTGKNKFAGADTTVDNGITFKKNSDGSYNIVGTSTSQANAYNYVDINNSGLVNGQTYTFWASQVLPAEFFVLIEAYNGTTWQRHAMNGLKDVNQSESQVINLTDTTRIRFALRVNEGTTINISNLKIQLESGSTATNFEKYTGGIASPNPQYEQPINSAGDNFNLLPNEATNQTINGLTFVINEDKSITINGTATANTNYTIIGQSGVATEVLRLKANQSYYNTTSLRLVYRLVNGDYDAINSGAYTPTNDLSIRHIYLSIPSGTTYNNEVIYPQIIKGTSPKGYVPYGKGFINEVISNKNLFNMDGKPSEDRLSSAGYTLKYNDDKTITINGTGTGAYKFLSWELTLGAGTYIASGCPSGGSQNGYSFLIRVGNSSYWDYGNGVSFTLIEKTTIQVHPIRTGSDIPTFNNVTFKPMIRLSSTTSTSFVPHQEQNISIPCQQPMRSIGNVRDSFVKIDGVWYERHYVGSTILDTNKVLVNNSYTNVEYALIPKMTNDIQYDNYTYGTTIFPLFTHGEDKGALPSSGWDSYIQDGYVYNNATKLYYWMSFAKGTGQTAIRQKLDGMIYNYVLSTPTDLLCTQEQITALEQARTYKPITHILSADVVPAYLEVTYVRDLETVINNLS